MSGTAVSDSDVAVDWLQGVPQALRALEQYDRIAISLVTWMEVLSGARTPEREAAARESLSRLEIVPISVEIAEATVRIRQSQRLRLPDAIILATARHLNATLLTRNTSDFHASTPGVIIPYRL